jgi:hypothetical protein
MLVLCGRLSIRLRNVSRCTPIQELRQQVDTNRPISIRFNTPLLLRATRPPDTDRTVRELLGSLEPTEAVRSNTRPALRDCLAAYNPLGQFGSAALRETGR